MMSTRNLIAAAHPAMRTAGLGRVVVGRGFCLSTSSKLGLKESSSQTDVDYDKHKQDSLDKQKRGAGHWKSELASDSEEAVKADRGETGDAKEHTKKLQEQTKHHAEEKSKAGTSVHDGM
ncbi:Fc.00g030800.m01.CDS01 [Cosmosporella sp. VM-42]